MKKLAYLFSFYSFFFLLFAKNIGASYSTSCGSWTTCSGCSQHQTCSVTEIGTGSYQTCGTCSYTYCTSYGIYYSGGVRRSYCKSYRTTSSSCNCTTHYYTTYTPAGSYTNYRDCGQTNGSCAAGYYSSNSAATWDGECHYQSGGSYVSSGYCGGTSVTCYKRGSMIPVDGQCSSPEVPYGHGCPETYSFEYNRLGKCGGKDVGCYLCICSWSVGSWGACSASCGGGTQSRSVYCASTCSYCNGTKPTATRSCNTQACCSPTDGTCNTGDYTTAAAAAGSGTCKYTYTSYTTTNASCGGTNITCYKRGTTYSNPTNGTCQTGYRNTVCTSLERQVDSYLTFNATCGGTNIYCYKCALKSCSDVNTYNNGSADCRYCLSRDDYQCLNFPSPTPIPGPLCATAPNQDDVNKCVLTNVSGVLTVSCSQMSSTNPYVFSQGNNSGDGTKNYRPIACSELNALYTTADKCTGSQLPVPIENFCSGEAYVNGLSSQCVTCKNIHAPWFQVVNGNLYAKGSIEADSTLANVFVMRNDDENCATSSAAGVGIPIAGDKIINITSQSASSVTADFSNGMAKIDPEDYSFFVNRLGYTTTEIAQKVKACTYLDSNDPNLFTIKDGFICLAKASNSMPLKLSNLLANTSSSATLTVPAGIKKVVFVDGNLELDRQIILQKSTNPNLADGVLVFIVSGNITISSYLGEFLTPSNFSTIGGSCANQEPSLHGLFVANGTIVFASGGLNNGFTNTTVNRNCDKKITIKGSFIGWGKNETNQPGISMSRTFAGCVKGTFTDSSVPSYASSDYDYNASTPVITFVYDANLINNLPAWINKNIWARFEVQ